MNQELEQSITTLLSQFKTKINDNKGNKIKLIIVSVVAGISLIGSIILAVLLVLASKPKDKEDLNDAVGIKKNPNGTQILPDTPELDKTIEKINKDIIK